MVGLFLPKFGVLSRGFSLRAPCALLIAFHTLRPRERKKAPLFSTAGPNAHGGPQEATKRAEGRSPLRGKETGLATRLFRPEILYWPGGGPQVRLDEFRRAL